MKPDKVRDILKKERPDLIDVEREGRSSAAAADDDFVGAVDERETTSEAWKSRRRADANADETKADEVNAMAERKIDPTQGMSADEIRDTFAPRRYASNSSAQASSDSGSDEPFDPKAGFVRVVKRRDVDTVIAANLDASGAEAKDLFIDEDEGILGSQG